MEAIKELIQKYKNSLNFWEDHLKSKIESLEKAESSLAYLETTLKALPEMTYKEYDSRWIELKSTIIAVSKAIDRTNGRIVVFEKVLFDLNEIIKK